MKLWQKGLIGCTAGCFLLVVGVGVALMVGTWWVVAPGKQAQTERIVTPESVGGFHLESVRSDPGAKAFVEGALLAIDRANRRVQREQLPEDLAWIQDMGGSSTAGFGLFIPKDISLALESVDGQTEPALVVAANLSSFPRMLKMIFEDEADREYLPEGADERLLGFGPTAFVAFEGGTLLFSNNAAALEEALYRLGQPAEAGAVTGGFEPEWQSRFDLYGTVSNRGGFLDEVLGVSAELELSDEDQSVLDRLREEETSTWSQSETAGLEQVRLGVDFQSADRVALVAEATCASVDEAIRWVEVIEEAFLEWSREPMGADSLVPLEAITRSEVSGLIARVEVDLSGFERFLEAEIYDALKAEVDDPQPPPEAPLEADPLVN